MKTIEECNIRKVEAWEMISLLDVRLPYQTWWMQQVANNKDEV